MWILVYRVFLVQRQITLIRQLHYQGDGENGLKEKALHSHSASMFQLKEILDCEVII